MNARRIAMAEIADTNTPEIEEGGNFIEENEPKEFFEHPKSERLKAFLSKVL